MCWAALGAGLKTLPVGTPFCKNSKETFFKHQSFTPGPVKRWYVGGDSFNCLMPPKPCRWQKHWQMSVSSVLKLCHFYTTLTLRSFIRSMFLFGIPVNNNCHFTFIMKAASVRQIQLTWTHCAFTNKEKREKPQGQTPVAQRRNMPQRRNRVNSKDSSQFTPKLLKPDPRLESSSIVVTTQLICGCVDSVHTCNTASHPVRHQRSKKWRP